MRFTSGTTSTAKGVVISHSGILARTAICQQIIDVTPDDRVLSPLPLSYHFIASVMSFIQAGATVLDATGLEGSAFALFAQATAPTLAYAAPAHYQALYDYLQRGDLASLRKAISASEPLRPELARLFESRFDLRLIQAYGIIEVGLPLWNDNSRWSPGDLGSVKAPYEGRLVDGSSCPETHGSVGELAVRGPGLFSGYLLHSGEIRTHPSDGWFLTGDVVTRSTDGTLAFKGRKQSRILIGEQHIYPEEIEVVLKRSPEIIEARVSAERDPFQGERLIAEIVSRDKTSSSLPSWWKLCEELLPPPLRPKEFRIVAAIPSTGSGKIIRHSNL
jgi:long-chain acyl-CoA synthetase